MGGRPGYGLALLALGEAFKAAPVREGGGGLGLLSAPAAAGAEAAGEWALPRLTRPPLPSMNAGCEDGADPVNTFLFAF